MCSVGTPQSFDSSFQLPAANRTHLPPNSDNAALIALARAAAAQHSLDAALICAIVEQESAWDPHAIRYEPAFRSRYVAPLGLPPTEEVARSISWGLMQVMGQVAREQTSPQNASPHSAIPPQASQSAAQSSQQNCAPVQMTAMHRASQLTLSIARSNSGTAASTQATPRKSSPA